MIKSALFNAVDVHGHGHHHLWSCGLCENRHLCEQAVCQHIAQRQLLMVFELMQQAIQRIGVPEWRQRMIKGWRMLQADAAQCA